MLHFIVLLELIAPIYAMAYETAKVLPKGVYRLRVVGVQTEAVSDRFNDGGRLEGFSAGLNRTVTVGDLAAKDPDVAKLVNALNSVQAGLGNQLLQSDMYSTFQTTQVNWIPALEYGLTDRTTIGIKIPIVKRSVRTGFWVNDANNGLSVAQTLGVLNPDLNEGLEKFGNMNFGTDFFVDQLYLSKGYENPRDFDRTEIGDIELGAKYNFYKEDGWILSVTGGGRIPVGSAPSLTNPFDIGSGVGAWGVGAQLVESYQPYGFLDFRSMQKLTYNFQDTRARAVPRDANDLLPSLLPQDGQVQDVTRDQAMLLETELITLLYFNDEAISTWGAYQFAAKGRDRYSGAGNLNYDGLSVGSDFEKHTAELGAGYSTIPAFRKKKFAIPGEVQLLWNTTLFGRNIPLASYLRMDFMAYF